MVREGKIVADKPASRPIAKGLPARGKFYAQYALPGLVPVLVMDGTTPAEYMSEAQARVAALEALFELLTRRLVDTRWRNNHEVCAPAEFARLLGQADVTPTYFAELYGTTQARVMQWLDGAADIPHAAYVMVNLLSIEAAYEMAAKLAKGRMSE